MGTAICLDLSTLCSNHVVVRPFETVAKQVHGMWLFPKEVQNTTDGHPSDGDTAVLEQ